MLHQHPTKNHLPACLVRISSSSSSATPCPASGAFFWFILSLIVGFALVLATGPVGGGTVTGCGEIPALVAGAGRYLRLTLTPRLSASETDTGQISAVWVLGGADRIPA